MERLKKISIRETYKKFYNSLKEIRELFHKAGRFDDSNAKLDEIVKLLSMYLAEKKHWIEPEKSLSQLLDEAGKKEKIYLVKELKTFFSAVTTVVSFKNQEGSSIFGVNPQLNIHDGDNDFAYHLSKLIVDSMDDAIIHNTNGHPFDLINEAFGHFIRDNFRGNIEDAQYMTPPEVVDFMVRIALHDILKENPQRFEDEFIMMDPACGVGSFLAAFYREAIHLDERARSNIKSFGQDKVDRMVRLSTINMLLFDTASYQITIGNSITGTSALDEMNGQVDLILTNPPFNAKFSCEEIRNTPQNHFPLLHGITNNSKSNIDSELLFIDRGLSLLKERGKLLIVLPDSVISSRGQSQTLRERLKNKVLVRAIVELPTVTFAQAGTRTKTCILYIEKCFEGLNTKKEPIFIAKANDLGFEVSSRKGIQIKISKGKNELSTLYEHYTGKVNGRIKKAEILCESPSCVRMPYSGVIDNAWTPSHYNAFRFKAIKKIEEAEGIVAMPLKDLANFVIQKRKREIHDDNFKCISVLHIIGDGMFNIKEMLKYQPKTEGIPCKPGDILFSKINPRIPRVLIVPDLGIPLTCSSEFEILESNGKLSNYALVMLLLSETAQSQIQNLTSGTSSSHNRIKTRDLENVYLPVPRESSKKSREFKKYESEYRNCINSMIKNTWKLTLLKEYINSNF